MVYKEVRWEFNSVIDSGINLELESKLYGDLISEFIWQLRWETDKSGNFIIV